MMQFSCLPMVVGSSVFVSLPEKCSGIRMIFFFLLFILKVKSQTRKKFRPSKREIWSNCGNVLVDFSGSTLNSKQVWNRFYVACLKESLSGKSDSFWAMCFLVGFNIWSCWMFFFFFQNVVDGDNGYYRNYHFFFLLSSWLSLGGNDLVLLNYTKEGGTAIKMKMQLEKYHTSFLRQNCIWPDMLFWKLHLKYFLLFLLESV